MDVKLCPKCNAKNWPDKQVCALCNTSLEGVPLTGSPTAGEPAPSAAPAAMQAPVAQTQQMPAGPPAQSHDHTGLPPNVHPYAPVRPMSPPVELKTNPWPIVLGVAGVLILAAIAAYIGMPKKPALPADPPQPTVSAFLEAKKSHDLEKVKPCLTAGSLDFLDTAFSTRQARSAGFDKAAVADMFVFDVPPSIKDLTQASVSLKNITTEQDKNDATAVVEVTVTRQIPILGAMSDVCEFVLAPEAGKWKIDLVATRQRQSKSTMDNLLGGPSTKKAGQ